MSLLQELLRGGWLRTVDHALGVSLDRLRPETPDAVLAAAALCSRALAQGHSQLPLSQVSELLLDLAPERELPALPPLDEWLTMLRASPWCTHMVGASLLATSPSTIHDLVASKLAPTPLMLDGDALSLRRYWHYELRLAAAIRARLATPPSAVSPQIETRLAELFPEAAGADTAQADAARALLGRHFLLLTGGPGTGKTTTVARALVLFAENAHHVGASLLATNPSNVGASLLATKFAPEQELVASKLAPTIALAAPTGKAAARLAESVRDSLAQMVLAGTLDEAAATALAPEAKTLHRLLGWQPGSTEFRHDAANPLPADLVIVDEASMIDLPLMCKLVEAVSPSATLLLIGDRDQLPSVETGDVLAALCDALPALPIVGASLLATSSASEPHLVASELAPTGARAARVHLTHSHRQRADVDVAALAELVRDGKAEAALHGLSTEAFRGVTWREGGDRSIGEAVLTSALPAFRGLATAATVTAALAEAKQFRVLTAVREGAAGSQTLNAQVAAALDPARRGTGFFHGRLVLITENSYRHGLFNGDIGIAWREYAAPDGAPVEPTLRVWFDADGGPRAWLPSALPAHESAFALTVHKSQGSEFERVFLALPERGARSVSRELLYTGLTRCRQAVTVWATEATLREGIARRAQRWSGLAARLTGFESPTSEQ